ncbi:MAG: PEP-CTERM sorting domain-containing protein [Cyanobacteriota bacterium]|nr:PEP-CTERM sorting domain-containing protein [Cyanobacteriota bacterium]
MKTRKSIFAAAVATATFFAAPLAANAASFSKVATDQEMMDLMEDLAFVAEGRMGNNDIDGDHELNFHGGEPLNESKTQKETNFVWTKGQTYDFKLDYTASTGLTEFFVNGVQELSYNFSDAFSDIFIRTRATKTGSSAVLDNIFLNGDPLNGASSFASGDDDGLDILRISGLSNKEDFSLTGKSTFDWGDIAPKNSHLAFQIKVADVESESTPEPTVLFGLGLASASMGLLRRRKNG